METRKVEGRKKIARHFCMSCSYVVKMVRLHALCMPVFLLVCLSDFELK